MLLSAGEQIRVYLWIIQYLWITLFVHNSVFVDTSVFVGNSESVGNSVFITPLAVDSRSPRSKSRGWSRARESSVEGAELWHPFLWKMKSSLSFQGLERQSWARNVALIVFLTGLKDEQRTKKGAPDVPVPIWKVEAFPAPERLNQNCSSGDSSCTPQPRLPPLFQLCIEALTSPVLPKPTKKPSLQILLSSHVQPRASGDWTSWKHHAMSEQLEIWNSLYLELISCYNSNHWETKNNMEWVIIWNSVIIKGPVFPRCFSPVWLHFLYSSEESDCGHGGWSENLVKQAGFCPSEKGFVLQTHPEQPPWKHQIPWNPPLLKSM